MTHELQEVTSFWIPSVLLIPTWGHSDANLYVIGHIVPLGVTVKEPVDLVWQALGRGISSLEWGPLDASQEQNDGLKVYGRYILFNQIF